ncbi:adenine-specific DNA-methyltransferase [Vreelandella subterranea]|uniref:Methyltransferase n=1 Tax=Vreelandella subterranea TaxID=416874 RepID=A0A1H9PK83_9GAMM|nr:site-specific DNA-methyltransferase [Halomonas subterranea]SER48527.1 adenine-specific DNA-methyltransferase [Halomonas subterranea]
MNPIFKTTEKTINNYKKGGQASVYQGDYIGLIKKLPDDSVDLIFSSPPYCIGKAYESTNKLSDFIFSHEIIFKELVRVLKPGGSLCWQVGMHVKDGVSTPLDSLVYAESIKHFELKLRNRIIWTFGHGLHCHNRFSGRHETIMWFTKGNDYDFNLDAVRVKQKYPGKTSSKGIKKGQPSGNPLGKNPGDVWNIPNVKANHIEKTNHPCQFPVALPQIFIRALVPENGLVFDPFSGSGTTAVASLIENKYFIGSELCNEYNQIAHERILSTLEGLPKARPWNKEVATPNIKSKVATAPEGYGQPENIMDNLVQSLSSSFQT